MNAITGIVQFSDPADESAYLEAVATLERLTSRRWPDSNELRFIFNAGAKRGLDQLKEVVARAKV